MIPGPSLQETLLRKNVSTIVKRYSNLGSNNPFKGPTARSLFYEAAKRTPNAYGQFLFYSLGNNENDFVDSYYKSENAEYNRRVSSLKSKNPSAGYLVRETSDLESIIGNNEGRLSGFVSKFEKSIIGGLSAPYYWKDFLYCKYYGTIPNNYMITLRRFPTPVLDNLSVPESVKTSEAYLTKGAGRPVAQAVTWFGGNTGNVLSSLIQFTTGLEWDPDTQADVITQEATSKGFYGDLPYKWFSEAARVVTGTDDLSLALQSIGENAAIYADPNNTTVESRRYSGLRDRATGGNFGLLSKYQWVPMDVIKDTYVRKSGLKFTWENLNVVFEYDLTSVGEVNTKAAMLDIMGNLLSIGTNYGNFLSPDIKYNSEFPAVGFPGGEEGLLQFYKDPLNFILTYGEKILNAQGQATKSAQGAQITGEISPGASTSTENSDLAELRAQILQLTNKDGATVDINKIRDLSKKFPGALRRILQNVVTADYIEKIQASSSLLTGTPIGEWHLTIGNPCNPIAMIGNLICDDLKIEFGDALGPDDFPTTIKATFTLKHARSRERGEIESIFNRGDGRLYQSSLETSSSLQSYDAYADTAGNILSEEVIKDTLTLNPYGADLPDQKAPGQ